jgi:hypothetical protein
VLCVGMAKWSLPLTSIVIKRPCELFHMDLVGPARVCSAGGK